MNGIGNILSWSFAAILSLIVAGCAPHGNVPTLTAARAGNPVAITFDDLAVVLSATVDQAGRVDATALAVNLPRLKRQVDALAGHWPATAHAGDARLAWLCNARAAWSLWVIAEHLRPLGGRGDAFELPETIGTNVLLDRRFVLDGKPATLRDIDAELAREDDFRLAATAPCATDLGGKLSRRPFSAEEVRSSLRRRFQDLIRDGDRVVIDHADRRLRVPPALWRVAGDLPERYNKRFNTQEASLATALGPYLDAAARRRLAGATDYPAAPRRGPAGIVAVRLSPLERRKIFGPCVSCGP